MRRKTGGGLELPWDRIRVGFLLAVFFALGGAAGVMALRFLTEEAWASLSRYLSDYMLLVRTGDISPACSAFVLDGLRLFLAAFMLCFVFWGVFGFPLLFLVRGFFLAYAAACFWGVFGFKGLVFAGILFGVPSLLWSPALFLLGVSGFMRGQQQLRGSVCRDRYFPGRVLFALLLICLWVLTECFVVPVLLRSAALFFFPQH